MKNWMVSLVVIAAILALCVLGVILGLRWFDFVLASDFPDWVKYLLLRG